MEYLASIGASTESSSLPTPPHTGHAPGGSATPPTKGNKLFYWGSTILLCMLLLLCLAGLAPGAELGDQAQLVPPGSPIAGDSDRATSERLQALEVEVTRLREEVARIDIHDALNEYSLAIERQLQTFRESFDARMAAELEQSSNRTAAILANLEDYATSITKVSAIHQNQFSGLEAQIADLAELTSHQIAGVGRSATDNVHAFFNHLSAALAQYREETAKAHIGIGLTALLLLSLAAYFIYHTDKRIRHIAEHALLHSPAMQDVTNHGIASGVVPQVARRQAVKSDAGAIHAPRRPMEKPLLSPDEQVRQIIEIAKADPNLRISPALATEEWGLGLASCKGYVRDENQDFGLAFKIGSYLVLIVADGCGGLPHGQRAAYLAALSAAISVINQVNQAPRWQRLQLANVASKAIRTAGRRLTLEGDKLGIAEVRGGLRTTLIVVIGNGRSVGYGYIGDGGGFIVKATGDVIPFLHPQKANGFSMNVLAASLGPTIEGELVAGTVAREAGEIVLVGSDGIFDRVAPTFSKDVLRVCIQHSGDLQKASEMIVEELAGFQDPTGYICDDNLTLGIMGDGVPPRLAPGFWAPDASTSE